MTQHFLRSELCIQWKYCKWSAWFQFHVYPGPVTCCLLSLGAARRCFTLCFFEWLNPRYAYCVHCQTVLDNL